MKQTGLLFKTKYSLLKGKRRAISNVLLTNGNTSFLTLWLSFFPVKALYFASFWRKFSCGYFRIDFCCLLEINALREVSFSIVRQISIVLQSYCFCYSCFFQQFTFLFLSSRYSQCQTFVLPPIFRSFFIFLICLFHSKEENHI